MNCCPNYSAALAGEIDLDSCGGKGSLLIGNNPLYSDREVELDDFAVSRDFPLQFTGAFFRLIHNHCELL